MWAWRKHKLFIGGEESETQQVLGGGTYLSAASAISQYVYGERNIVHCAVSIDDGSDARDLFTLLNIKSSEIDNAALTFFDFDSSGFQYLDLEESYSVELLATAELRFLTFWIRRATEVVSVFKYIFSHSIRSPSQMTALLSQSFTHAFVIAYPISASKMNIISLHCA